MVSNSLPLLSSRPGRPPKRASIGLSLAASHLSHQLKKHRLENGDYGGYENGHLSGECPHIYFSRVQRASVSRCSGFWLQVSRPEANNNNIYLYPASVIDSTHNYAHNFKRQSALKWNETVLLSRRGEVWTLKSLLTLNLSALSVINFWDADFFSVLVRRVWSEHE